MNTLEYLLFKAIHDEGLDNSDWWIGHTLSDSDTNVMFGTNEAFPIKEDTPYLALWIDGDPLSEGLWSIINERPEYVSTETIGDNYHFYLFELSFQTAR